MSDYYFDTIDKEPFEEEYLNMIQNQRAELKNNRNHTMAKSSDTEPANPVEHMSKSSDTEPVDPVEHMSKSSDTEPANPVGHMEPHGTQKQNAHIVDNKITQVKPKDKNVSMSKKFKPPHSQVFSSMEKQNRGKESIVTDIPTKESIVTDIPTKESIVTDIPTKNCNTLEMKANHTPPDIRTLASTIPPRMKAMNPLALLNKQLEDTVGISRYLTDAQMDEAGPYGCRLFDNDMKNFEALTFIGMLPKKPTFMLTTREKKLADAEHQEQLKRKQESEKMEGPWGHGIQGSRGYGIQGSRGRGSDDSDEEWTPYTNKRRKTAPQSNLNRKSTAQRKNPSRTVTSGALEASSSTEPTPPTSRYPLRASARARTYMLLEVDDDDDFLYCEECNIEYSGDCPTHGPLNIVEDKQVPKGTEDRAMKTLPDFLYVKVSHIPNAGKGVFTKTRIEIRVRFGPYEGDSVGVKAEAQVSGYSWQIRDDKKKVHFVDAVNEKTSNWLRYVNCARTEDEQNLHAYQHQGQIYYRTYKPIPPGTELLVYYGAEYAKDLGIDRLFTMSVAGTGIKCDLCIMAFSDVKYLYLHKKHKHSVFHDTTAAKYPVTEVSGKMKKRHQCTVCEYNSDNSGDLKRHLLTHSGEKPFACTQCQYATTCSSALKKHMLAHSSIRPHKCPHCPYAATQAGDLRKHILTHTKEKPFKCTICDYACIQSSDMKKHMLTHSKEKPFRCSKCPYACNHSNSLQAHMLSHSGSKPFQCPKCQFACNRSDNLRNHMYTHGGEKPHKCLQCEYSCISKGQLRNHMKNMHSISEE